MSQFIWPSMPKQNQFAASGGASQYDPKMIQAYSQPQPGLDPAEQQRRAATVAAAKGAPNAMELRNNAIASWVARRQQIEEKRAAEEGRKEAAKKAAEESYQMPGYAEGGEVEGPGGPTDDMVPAVVNGQEPVQLSDEEFIMTAIAKKYWGTKKLNEMNQEAEMAEEQAEPAGMSEASEGEEEFPGFFGGGEIGARVGMTSPKISKPIGPVPGYARGGELNHGNNMGQAIGMIQAMMGIAQQQKDQQQAQEMQPLQMDLLRAKVASEQRQGEPDQMRQDYYKSQTNANDAQGILQLSQMARVDPRIARFLAERYGMQTETPQQMQQVKHPGAANDAIRQRAQQLINN